MVKITSARGTEILAPFATPQQAMNHYATVLELLMVGYAAAFEPDDGLAQIRAGGTWITITKVEEA